ncbi:phospho-sugar mutase [Bacillus massiliigorillae]|uniref:phospho-sugar mutase n=1 Tax=Bacillus massiliigorillae TaxID=1243664 RepID=UPI0003A2115A|nr:phospho-sugar mutase [Bacillus massiliigorillae]
MAYKKEYQKWLNSSVVNDEMKAELRSLENNDNELKHRFSSMLDFGTAGLRGIMGAGLNNMNEYTVRYATQGLSDLILQNGAEAAKKGVCIAYDSRLNSVEFAWEAACNLSANGIAVYIFDELRPTPELSFAIREFGAIAGINITASHNPKEYNGYKVYWEDGAQLPPEHAKQISDRLQKLDIFADVKTCSKEEAMNKGLITVVGKDFDEKYMEKVLGESVGSTYVNKVADDFRMIYSPIHGTGYRIVPEVLTRLGIKHLITVPEQMEPNGLFPTTKSPNPEEKEALQIAIQLAEKENVDLIVGTDPDADRVGIVVRNFDGEYVTLTGNQIGVLLLDYLIQSRKANGTLADNAVVIKSIVSSNMAKAIAEQNHVAMMDVLTGFKFIGEKIKEFEQTNEHTFLFGFEESNGYLAGTYARDKDAIVASMLIAEMACYYQLQNMTLYEALFTLYKKYGYFDEKVVSITLSGLDGIEKIKTIMSNLRENVLTSIATIPVTKVRDYKTGKVTNISTSEESSTGLPIADVLFYELEDGSSFIVRPSGTEPKLKLYIMVKADSHEEALKKKEELVTYGKSLVEKMSQNDVLI